MLEALLFVHTLNKTTESVRNAFKNLEHKRKIGTVAAVLNGFVAIEMLLFNYGLDKNREVTPKGARCLTQAESNAIMGNSTQMTAKRMNDFVEAQAAIRLIYRGERNRVFTERYRDTLRSIGVDVSVSAPDGIEQNGTVRSCRVDVIYPFTP